MRHFFLFVCSLVLSLSSPVLAKTTTAAPSKAKSPLSAEALSGLNLRGIGPAVSSGRITDFAVDPGHPDHFFVASASGGVWKTINGGTTFDPIFDAQGSYSIGCITLDPNNPDIVWVGAGENNSQRSVSFGDGVYRSLDGGTSWENLGLKDSEHIGMIIVDPRDSNTVYVAAQGPLWRDGGDRGLFKSIDGGKTWKKSLEISPMTGVNEVHFDPRNADVLYASSYQRRRRVWTLIDGGPESAIYKSTDAGEHWRKITQGLPSVDMGRIGLAISPANPDVLYAIIEAVDDNGGFFRSTDRGESWKKQSDYVTGSPQYYNEIVPDPKDVDRVYSLETWMKVTTDGGKSFSRIGSAFRHVDDHAMWIDPDNPLHLLVGCDGGVYESRDGAATYAFKANLPVAQFYRVAVDNSEPFYFIYGGTQDNATLGGPSRTRSKQGIVNSDWFVTVFGDGFQTRVDPEDPNIVYSEAQYGGLVRHDRRSGEIVDIQPIEPPGEKPWHWNWDAPLIISPHSHTRLYFAASRLFRSDDRGNSWQIISPDLTAGIDRDALKVMGKIQHPDAVAKHESTSIYGNAVALSESPLVEGLIYIGTDDGLIWISPDGGTTWTKETSFPGIPAHTYVAHLEASVNDPDTVFATFDNHKDGDFKPYVLKSTDRGQTWASIAGDLPERGMIWTVVEDEVKSDLLFAGSEFGLYFTPDGGKRWIKLSGNMPTVAIRDIAVQRREHDLVLATFGRGFYVLDDYTPLREVSEDLMSAPAHLFGVRDALEYIQISRFGLPLKKAFQGDSFFSAPNPPYGAIFTYHLAEGFKNLKESRHQAEEAADKDGKVLEYPTTDQLRAEDEALDPVVLLQIRDHQGRLIRNLKAEAAKGIHRIAWDLRYPATTPVDLDPPPPSPWSNPPSGAPVLPGTYSAKLSLISGGEVKQLTNPVDFKVKALDIATFPTKDRKATLAFRRKAAELQRVVNGASENLQEAFNRLRHLRQALLDTPDASLEDLDLIENIRSGLNVLKIDLEGDSSPARRNYATAPSIIGRVENVVQSQFFVSSAPTATNQSSLEAAHEAFKSWLPKYRELEAQLSSLEKKLDAEGAPWTPGRVPGN